MGEFCFLSCPISGEDIFLNDVFMFMLLMSSFDLVQELFFGFTLLVVASESPFSSRLLVITEVSLVEFGSDVCRFVENRRGGTIGSEISEIRG